MQKKRWENEFVMDLSLFHETLDEMVDFVTGKINSGPVVEVPPFAVVASPSKDGVEHPDLSFWLVVGEFGMNTKYPITHALGKKVGEEHIVLSAVFLITESWILALESKDQLPPKGTIFEDIPDRIEIISIVGMDIEHRFASAFIHLDRQPDNNMMIIKNIEKNYPQPGEKAIVKSDLLDTFMGGYVNGMHMAVYGAEIDPSNPLKHIKPKGSEPVKTDS